MEFRIGSLVEYKVGRGWGSGKVTAINGSYLTIQTNKGTTFVRSVDKVRKQEK